jgi:Histidine kinase-, DNA gyrase B-, and HSP90-like ATPase
MAKKLKQHTSKVSTKPVKRFFVDMLTRDIDLADAILDLLDNCVDGLVRSTVLANGNADKKPYKGYWAQLKITKNSFVIEDNCGGIPWDERDRAFRMGKPLNNHEATSGGKLLVGAYGIGMKRAIFKIGQVAEIHTKTPDDEYLVSIPKGWMEDEEDWDLGTHDATDFLKQEGTKISVTDLRGEISDVFDSEIFQKEIFEKISTHYSIIISKGFKVTLHIGGKPQVIQPKTLGLHFQEKPNSNGEVIRPYVFQSTEEAGLEVTVAVGLREPIPGVEAILNEQDGPKFTSDFAGWTVICNDRVVLHCNRDEMTGWGTGGVPRYHTQFIAISGFVEFKGDPRKLPTTTTKRGLEFSSRLYQQVLDRMREGTLMFTTYTNWWKSREVEAKNQVTPTPSLELPELKRKVSTSGLTMAAVRTGLTGKQYKPVLPKPTVEQVDVRIAYYKPKKLVDRLASKVLDNIDDYEAKDIPRAVGEALFDDAVKQYRIK